MAQVDGSTPITHRARYAGKDSRLRTAESLCVFWWPPDNGNRSPSLLKHGA